MRIGHGFDLHRLEAGKRLVLAGVDIPGDRGAAAHSDGDAVLHALTDAVLGALGQPDIGELFPDTDPQWQGQDSSLFLDQALRRMRSAGYQLGNADVTVILQTPKLSPYKAAMRKRLAELLGVAVERVNLKGKTHEKVDAVGEGRAVACHAVVLLESTVSG
ncbi:MAG: 2-C-methyl-D-erythritol 2,4-cyclodiphosphate synthase [Planctomycetota bacterium]